MTDPKKADHWKSLAELLGTAWTAQETSSEEPGNQEQDEVNVQGIEPEQRNDSPLDLLFSRPAAVEEPATPADSFGSPPASEGDILEIGTFAFGPPPEKPARKPKASAPPRSTPPTASPTGTAAKATSSRSPTQSSPNAAPSGGRPRPTSHWGKLANDLGLPFEEPEPEPLPPPVVHETQMESVSASIAFEPEIIESTIDDESPSDWLSSLADEVDEPVSDFEPPIDLDQALRELDIPLTKSVAPRIEEEDEELSEKPRKRRRRRRRRGDRPDRADAPAQESDVLDEPAELAEIVDDEEPLDAPDLLDDENGVAPASDEDSDRPRRRRRRRRRRGGRGEGTEAAASPRSGKSSRTPPADDDIDDLDEGSIDTADVLYDDPDDLDDRSDVGGSVHRKIPTWDEAINLIVTFNLEQRKREPQGGHHGRGRGRGRR